MFFIIFSLVDFLTFRLDENGEINRISYSNQVRDSYMTTLAPENVKKFYKALLLMDKLLYENVLTYKMNSGKFLRDVSIEKVFLPHF